MMAAIGNTPLLQLKKLTPSDSAEVWVKWEGANPTGSMKDRMAVSIIDGAEARGELLPGYRVLDYTGGSTGSSLAMVCAARGYGSYFVTSDAFAESKLNTMRLFGAELEIVPGDNGKITPELFQRCFDRVDELRTTPGFFYADQFRNVDNRRAYNAMGDEIVKALDGQIDGFVACVGTGGCFSGVAERLKANSTATLCYPVEPMQSQAIAGLATTGGHRLEGVGAGFVPSILRTDLASGTLAVADEDAMATARLLARTEGICGGTSSGANVFAALELARRLGPGRRVVTVICDTGLKYLDGDLYRA